MPRLNVRFERTCQSSPSEGAHVDLAGRESRIPRVDAELGRATAQRANLRGGEPKLLEQQCAAILFDRVILTITGWPEASRTGRLFASNCGARPPPKVNVPPKFCGEASSTVAARSRTPKRKVWGPWISEV